MKNQIIKWIRWLALVLFFTGAGLYLLYIEVSTLDDYWRRVISIPLAIMGGLFALSTLVLPYLKILNSGNKLGLSSKFYNIFLNPTFLVFILSSLILFNLLFSYHLLSTRQVEFYSIKSVDLFLKPPNKEAKRIGTIRGEQPKKFRVPTGYVKFIGKSKYEGIVVFDTMAEVTFFVVSWSIEFSISNGRK